MTAHLNQASSQSNDFQSTHPQSADAVGFTIPGESSPPEPRYEAEDDILKAARQVAETVLGPKAAESDRATGPNVGNFRALADAGLLGLSLPREYGGLEASGKTQREYTELLASHCGVTTFVQAQHHGPSRMIAGGPDESLKQQLLAALASGKMMCAISFAHLRRPGPPVLKAEPVPGGFRLNGIAPWVTGWGLMNQVVFGATLPDESFVYVWSPASPKDFPELFADRTPSGGDWGELIASAPLPICAMNASATVELTCKNWFVPEAHLLHRSDRETLRRNDRNGVLNATSMPLGCSAASVRVLCETAESRSLPAIRRAASAFAAEWEDVKAQIEDWNLKTERPDFFETAIRLRAWVIELSVRAAHAAVTASSGAANRMIHPAQRLLREAMFYTIQAQTQEVMDETLQRLERYHGN